MDTQTDRQTWWPYSEEMWAYSRS